MIDKEHQIISGETQTGKSSRSLYQINDSFRHDRPCCYIDPKGETYRTLLAFLATTLDGQWAWETYRHRILFLNPISPSGYVLGFNALEAPSEFCSAQPDRIALLANSTTSDLRRQSGFAVSDAVRMQNIMAGAIGLLAHDQRYTLAEIPLLFVQTKDKGAGYNPFVKELLPLVEHLGTLSFWQDQYAHWTSRAQQEWVQSTLGRIFRFLFDERMLFTTCTVEHARLDFRRIVNEGYWLFVNLPYSFLSDTVTTVLGNLIIAKIFLACMQRPPNARPYRLILDEARLFNSGPLDQILDTSLAYNLSLTLVVQSLTQLARTSYGVVDWYLMETALNNARYIESFRNFTDKKILADLMFPVTGLKVVGTRASGDYDYQPAAGEENANERQFTELGFRQLIFWDKQRGKPVYAQTPDIVMSPADPATIDAFEAQHMQLTGVRAADIHSEIMARQEEVRRLLEPTRRSAPPAHFGREA